MIKAIATAVVVLLGALLIYAGTRPDTFRVQRATSIKAPPEKIFAVLTISCAGNPGRPGRRKTPR